MRITTTTPQRLLTDDVALCIVLSSVDGSKRAVSVSFWRMQIGVAQSHTKEETSAAAVAITLVVFDSLLSRNREGTNIVDRGTGFEIL